MESVVVYYAIPRFVTLRKAELTVHRIQNVNCISGFFRLSL